MCFWVGWSCSSSSNTALEASSPPSYPDCMSCHTSCVVADEKVSTELKKQITQARTAKKLTQAQLGQVSATTAWHCGWHAVITGRAAVDAVCALGSVVNAANSPPVALVSSVIGCVYGNVPRKDCGGLCKAGVRGRMICRALAASLPLDYTAPGSSWVCTEGSSCFLWSLLWDLSERPPLLPQHLLLLLDMLFSSSMKSHKSSKITRVARPFRTLRCSAKCHACWVSHCARMPSDGQQRQ